MEDALIISDFCWCVRLCLAKIEKKPKKTLKDTFYARFNCTFPRHVCINNITLFRAANLPPFSFYPYQYRVWYFIQILILHANPVTWYSVFIRFNHWPLCVLVFCVKTIELSSCNMLWRNHAWWTDWDRSVMLVQWQEVPGLSQAGSCLFMEVFSVSFECWRVLRKRGLCIATFCKDHNAARK